MLFFDLIWFDFDLVWIDLIVLDIKVLFFFLGFLKMLKKIFYDLYGFFILILLLRNIKEIECIINYYY